MQMLTVAVHNLDNLGAILPTVEALAIRHVGYNVTPDGNTAVFSPQFSYTS